MTQGRWQRSGCPKLPSLGAAGSSTASVAPGSGKRWTIWIPVICGWDFSPDLLLSSLRSSHTGEAWLLQAELDAISPQSELTWLEPGKKKYIYIYNRLHRLGLVEHDPLEEEGGALSFGKQKGQKSTIPNHLTKRKLDLLKNHQKIKHISQKVL